MTRLGLSLLTVAWLAHGDQAADPERGAVVETIEPGSIAETAGLAVGDVVVSWCRAGNDGACVAQGTIDSPLDLAEIDVEQLPRGGVKLALRRAGQPVEVALPRASLRLAARPVLDGELLAAYEAARQPVAERDAGGTTERLRAASAQAAALGDARLAIWFLIRAAELAERAKSWPDTDACYGAATDRALAANDSAAAVLVLRDWAYLATRRGRWAEAAERFERGLAIDRTRALDSLSIARTQNLQAITAAQRGDTDAAESILGQALAMAERLAPRSTLHSSVLTNLGNVAARRGDLSTAEHFAGQALAIEESLPGWSRALLASLPNNARLAAARGNLAKAEELLRRARTVAEAMRPDSLDLAVILDNLGSILMQQGDEAAAEGLVKRALAIKEQTDLSGALLATSYANLSHLARARGDLAATEQLLERALALTEQAAPGTWQSVAHLNNLAAVSTQRGNLDRAEELSRRALAILEANSAGAGAEAALVLQYLAELAVDRQQWARAEELLRRALAIRERMSPTNVGTAETLDLLGLTAAKQGRGDEAAALYCRAVDVAENQWRQLGGSDLGRAAFRSFRLSFFDNCLTAQVERGELAAAFATLERNRARSLLDLLAQRDLELAADLAPELKRRRKELAAAYDATQAEIAKLDTAGDEAAVGRLVDQLNEIRSEQGALAARIRRESPRFAALQYPQPLDLAGARAALDPGTVLLSYAVGQDQTHLFVVRASDAVGEGLTVKTLPVGRQQLIDAVAGYRRLLAEPAASRRELLAQGSALYRLLVQPAEREIAAGQRILLSLDRALHVLPFSALVRNGRFLVEWKPIHTALSATVYAELKRLRPRQPVPRDARLVVFGDPVYPGKLSAQPDTVRAGTIELLRAVERGLSLTPLPGTRKEAQEIAGLFPNTTPYVGPEATEERVKSLPRDVAYLHFACHGVLDEKMPLNSALALTLRASPKEGEDNGLLQAWEILEGLRFDAELVTLSACDSALGQDWGGEGLMSLTRAFQVAGARSVLASQWSIADGSTAELMQRFYRHLRDGKSKDEALRLAQIASIQQQGRPSHPASWAAFQLMGDWR